MASVQPIVGKLEELFETFNNYFYEGELEKPVITVSPDTTKGAYGWFTTWRAWKKDNSEDETDGFYEINVSAEHLNRDIKAVCATLLHEMAHLYCKQHEIKDTSRNGSYHNKKFKEVAELRGLSIECDQKYGWTKTSLTEDTELLIEGLDIQGFSMYRTKMSKDEKGSSKKKSSTRKYVCPTCGVIVRATKDVRIICAECDVELEKED